MSRTWTKPDDGRLDIFVKILGIGVFCFALYEYFFKIHPVWDKERQLSITTQKLVEADGELKQQELEITHLASEIDKQKQTLETISSDVKKKQQEIEALKVQVDKVKSEYERKLQTLNTQRLAAEQRMKKTLNDLEDSLRSAEHAISFANDKMVGVFLQSFAKDIHNIQIDHIRWSEERQLDLREDILNYVGKHLPREKDPIKVAAYRIFALYAEEKLGEGITNYSEAILAGVFYKHNQEARQIVKSIQNKANN